uniref:GIY-YIG nuclease family protein n=1 Tax=Streptomyces sp. NBC_00119 TaxID=2975659 RepID=A0AAU1U3D9_9ACTN
MPPSIPANVAASDMRRLGKAEPPEPYPGRAREPWMCRHIPCQQGIYPNRNNVMTGQGACIWCAPNAPKNPDEAKAAMLERGFIVLVDFLGTGKPWLSQCVAARHIVAPRYDNVTGRNGGCRFCKRYGPGDPHEAVADMRAVGFRPLEPFKNIASPWLSLCERCRKTSTPRLNNVRTRGECCQHCARYGLDPGAPARVYVLSHAEYGAVKIGVTGLRTREDRVARFRGHGWMPFTQIDFATGADAYRVEQSVIRRLRIEGHGVFLGDGQMPIGGYKETFDATTVSVERLVAPAEAER